MTVSAPPSLRARIEQWPIAGSFTISRGAKTEAIVVVAEIQHGAHAGRGECVPYARYGESPETTLAAIRELETAIAGGLTRDALQELLPAGAARNALDCAMVDLAARAGGRRAWELFGAPPPRPCTTAYTISLGTPDAMAAAAAKAAHRPLLKIKLGGGGDAARIAAVRAAAPSSELIVDANEAWTPDDLASNLDACAKAGVTRRLAPSPSSSSSSSTTSSSGVASRAR